MKNLLEDVAYSFVFDLLVTLNSGDAVVGRPGSLITGPNGRTGVFVLINPEAFEQYLSTCSIDIIQINNATYNDAIVYLPEPVPAHGLI